MNKFTATVWGISSSIPNFLRSRSNLGCYQLFQVSYRVIFVAFNSNFFSKTIVAYNFNHSIDLTKMIEEILYENSFDNVYGKQRGMTALGSLLKQSLTAEKQAAGDRPYWRRIGRLADQLMSELRLNPIIGSTNISRPRSSRHLRSTSSIISITPESFHYGTQWRDQFSTPRSCQENNFDWQRLWLVLVKYLEWKRTSQFKQKASSMDFFFKCIPSSYSKLSLREDEPCNLYRLENRAIAMSYFAVGIVGSLIITPLNIYLVETLNAGEICLNLS